MTSTIATPLPSIQNYGTGQGNSIVVTIGSLDVYFSYQTPVAFRHPDTGLVVRANDWGATTGKHLNWIDGGNKTNRVDSDTFRAKLASVTP